MTSNLIRTSLVCCALGFGAAQGVQALNTVDLRVSGPQSEALGDALRANSVLHSLVDNPEATTGDILAAARGDYARLVEVLYSQGYYSVEVSILVDGREAALIDPFRSPEQITNAVIAVDPGRLFRFGAVRIGPLAQTPPLPDQFRPDAPALATVAREATRQAVNDWRKAGHAKARITDQRVLARHDSARLDVDVDIAPGPRVRFGDVTVSGESAVRGSRVRSIAGLPRGERYDPDEVDKAAARLRKVGTFSSVQLSEAETVAHDGTMDMEIAVVDRRPRRIGGGLEYSSFDGVTLSGYWLHRNLLGGAEQFRVDGEIAQIGGTGQGTDYALSFRFDRPAVYGPDTLFFAEAAFTYNDEPRFLQEKFAFTTGVSREFSDTLSGSLGIGYEYARITDRFAPTVTRREMQLLRLPLSLTYDNRDDPLDATRGIYARAGLTPFYETFDAQTGGHATLDLRSYLALGETGGTVLAGRLQLGALAGPNAQAAPPDYLFYSGGAGTVRGQPYKSLTADYGGVELGGRSFAALSGELRFPVGDRIGLAAFADAGFVGGGFFEDGGWHAGAGLGVRYKTPVGPIRVDLAGPVAGDTGSGVQLYIGIGQAF
ncbi:autotransporter assembly complex protein TamA [Aquicoccus porphyridii]|nr:autotransporter assembly complex family protein [Aquicoccus porphyridii]